MLPVFDGHNDSLTREDHADLVGGREGGHLDLPRMREGGMRGGIFAVFTPSPDDTSGARRFGGNGYREPLAKPLEQGPAAPHAPASAGRLLRLEREGYIRVARAVADLDAAHDDDASSPPAAVLHLEGAEAIDPGLEALEHWYAAGLRSLGPVWSRANAFAQGVPFAFPSSPDVGPGLTDAAKALVGHCAQLGVRLAP